MNRTQQKGVGMVEVLVAIVVLSIGLLGLGGLQLLSLRNNQGASSRTQAIATAASIIDSIRVNRTAATDYRRDFPDPVPSYVISDPMFKQDYAQILNQLQRSMPNGQARVVVTPRGQPVRQTFDVRVTVRWSLGNRGLEETDLLADDFDEVVLGGEI